MAQTFNQIRFHKISSMWPILAFASQETLESIKITSIFGESSYFYTEIIIKMQKQVLNHSN